MTSKSTNVSAGLRFIEATAQAIPKSMGDRDRIAVMSEALALAIRNCFGFGVNDGEELHTYRIITCVGKFRPHAPHFYRLACIHGGTFAKMWEKYNKQKPWYAAYAIVPDNRRHIQLEDRIARANRVATGFGVLLPESFCPENQENASSYEQYRGFQVWWCTSVSDTEITICRYLASNSERNTGRPARVRSISREEWKTHNQAAIDQGLPQ